MYPCSCFVKADVEDEYKKIAVETDACGCILLSAKGRCQQVKSQRPSPVMILVRRSCSCHLRPGGARVICTNKVQMDYMSRIHKIHIHKAVDLTDQPDRRLRTVSQHLYFRGPVRQRIRQFNHLPERIDRLSELRLFPERNTHIIPILWRQIIHRNCFKKIP